MKKHAWWVIPAVAALLGLAIYFLFLRKKKGGGSRSALVSLGEGIVNGVAGGDYLTPSSIVGSSTDPSNDLDALINGALADYDAGSS